MTSDVKSKPPIILHFFTLTSFFVHWKSRSQQDAMVDPADIRGLVTTLLASVGCLPLFGWVAIGPGAFDQDATGMGIARLGDGTLATALATGGLRRREAQIVHHSKPTL
jgi:hypothetical protein